jgi:hypothetical protein
MDDESGVLGEDEVNDLLDEERDADRHDEDAYDWVR